VRAPIVSKFAIVTGIGATLPTLFACLEHPIKGVEYDKSAVEEEEFELTVNKDVDILFVIDNSGSMGEEQANLAANFGAFIELLEQEKVDANYRIGITTTDNSNPWCGSSTTPEAGKLQLSSCLGRLEHFTFTGSDPPTVVEDIACTDICVHDKAALDDRMVPTPTDLDPNHKVRPWLENIEHKTNLPPGISTVEAFQCFGPQGIDGCGFESHLESMYKGLRLTQDQSQASYGFLRENAILAIIIVTDEVDCSYQTEWADIFAAEGNRVFWSDPEAMYPTSAVCWNAGVECTGGPDTYDECHAADKNVDGNITTDPSAAVLHPVSRYVDLVQGFENDKKVNSPDQEVIVAVIAGVPDGYSTGMADILYANSPDPVFQTDFGIGPGCKQGDQTAVPPVREREWAESFGDRNLYSVCSNDYTPALQAIADRIVDQIRPACYTQCVQDTDAAKDGLQPACYVEQRVPGKSETTVPECKLVGGVYEQPTADDNVCWYTLTDQTQSGDMLDDMSDECVAEGYNLEFKVLRRSGFPAIGGSSMTATCSLSEAAIVDCPDLGG
jgi:hypothetical protein